MIAGDFNAKSPRWGANDEDRRGSLLSERIQLMELEVANCGSKPTFERRNQQSWIDVTICSTNVRLQNWRVTKEENLSDHYTLRFELRLQVSMDRPLSTSGMHPREWGDEN